MKTSNRGGKRPGSGRAPGPLTMELPPAKADRNPQITVQLTPQLARVHEAAAFYLAGLSFVEIGARLGCHRDTVSHWLREHPEVLDSERVAKRDPVRELAPHVGQAVRAYGDLLQPEVRADIRLHAADSVMDRVYGKPVTRQELRVQSESLIIFKDATDDAT